MAVNEVVIPVDDSVNAIDEALTSTRALVDLATAWLAKHFCEI